MNLKQFLILGIGSALLLTPAIVRGQDSVADAARKAQAEKKTAPKSKITINDDNVDSIKGTVSVVGEQPSTPADESKVATDKTNTATPPGETKPSVKDESYWRKEFAEANKKLADDAHELDILQREYNLKEQQYYSDPNTAMKEQFDRHDLTDTKAKIDDKTTAVVADKQAISDLEDALRQAGGDPGWETPPPQAPAAH